MNSIKVMPDYECHALWHHNSEIVGNIDPSDLPITDELANQFDQWANVYDRTLNRDDPTNSGFDSRECKVQFVAKGYELALQLKIELKDVEIVYYDIDQHLIRSI